MDTESAMQRAPSKVIYSFQRADYEVTPDSAPITLEEALSVLHSHDWQAELAYESELDNSGKEKPCPPGVDFFTDARRQLRVCPRRDGLALCYFWNMDSISDSWYRENVTGAEQDRLLELLFRGDYASLTQGFEPAFAVCYSVQRADCTYAQEPVPIKLAKAQTLLRDYDWKAALAYRHELEAAKRDWCPPNIEFTGAAGVLQIQPGTFEGENPMLFLE
jgi:hypothetical protein